MVMMMMIRPETLELRDDKLGVEVDILIEKTAEKIEDGSYRITDIKYTVLDLRLDHPIIKRH
jgi:hypothetical protein